MSTVGYDLNSAFMRSGIAVYARELVTHVARIADRPHLAILARAKQIPMVQNIVADAPNVTIHGVLPSELMFGEYGRPLARLMINARWRSLRDAIDLVHFHEGGRHIPPVRRFVVTIHDLFPLDPLIPCPPSLRKTFREQVIPMMFRADRILVPSTYVKGEIAMHFPEYAGKVRVTQLAASDRFVPSSAPHPYGGQPYLIWVGRLDERKNLHRILHAWEMLPLSLRTTARFVLVGPWAQDDVAKDHAELSSLLHSTGIELRSDVTSDEHRQLLTHAHGLIFPSIAEGFGLPVIEAMKCGAPVLTSTTSSLPEVAGDAAVTVDPTDVVAISHGMEQLLTDDILRHDLRRRGFERASMFSWERTAQQTLAIYREVLS